MEYNLTRVHTPKDLAISTVIFLSGVGLFFVNKGIGITLTICGLAMLSFYKGGYKKDGQGVVLRRKSVNLCKCCKPSIIDFLAGKDVNPEVKKGNEGGCIRLDVYFNAPAGIAYARLFDFRNYTFEPETEIVELHYARAAKLISQL